MAALATLGYEGTMADQHADKVFCLKASFAVEPVFKNLFQKFFFTPQARNIFSSAIY